MGTTSITDTACSAKFKLGRYFNDYIAEPLLGTVPDRLLHTEFGRFCICAVYGLRGRGNRPQFVLYLIIDYSYQLTVMGHEQTKLHR